MVPGPFNPPPPPAPLATAVPPSPLPVLRSVATFVPGVEALPRAPPPPPPAISITLPLTHIAELQPPPPPALPFDAPLVPALPSIIDI